jgi:acetyl-CoA/propionyl-CoA carboxylase biotin carboxyl carrier protein
MPRLTLHPAAGPPQEVTIEHRREPPGEEQFILSAGEETLTGTAELQHGSEGILRVGARVVRFYWARVDGDLQLWLGGEVYHFRVAEAGRADRRAEALRPGGEVAAPMPGLVLNVLVAPGQEVAAQAPLVVLESMKMELTIPAPAPGRVAEVWVAPGDRVDLGAPLLRLESPG